MQYSPSHSPVVPVFDTPVCNNNGNSIKDMPVVPIVDIPVCNNNNKSILDIPFPLSGTVSPQETPVTFKSLN